MSLRARVAEALRLAETLPDTELLRDRVADARGDADLLEPRLRVGDTDAVLAALPLATLLREDDGDLVAERERLRLTEGEEPREDEMVRLPLRDDEMLRLPEADGVTLRL